MEPWWPATTIPWRGNQKDSPKGLADQVKLLRPDIDIAQKDIIRDHVFQELARSYKEAQLAIEVGKVFETERTIVNYENLGIGRLIYQLPTTLCEMFLNEVFKKNPIDSLDYETLFTINKFFENNLNVSETARKLFVHRNISGPWSHCRMFFVRQ